MRLKVADLRVQGRATQGVRVINLEKRADTIASVCCVDSDNEDMDDEEMDNTMSGEVQTTSDSDAVENEGAESDNNEE